VGGKSSDMNKNKREKNRKQATKKTKMKEKKIIRAVQVAKDHLPSA
jgi:hypothetical protein